MRTAFINTLIQEARKNPRIMLVVGDLGFSVVEPFAKEFPDRYINAGVAEQNMAGLAAGLASEGYHVFTYSIANFPTFRCAEQIRNDVAYHNLAVTVVAVGGGLAYGSLGYSHHAVQDLGLMRLFPGMLLATPGDPLETAAVVRYLCAHPQPSYLRLGKAGEPKIHPVEPVVEPNQPLYIHRSNGRHGKLLLSIGSTLKLCRDAVQQDAGGEWDLASMPLWCTEGAVLTRGLLREYQRIAIVEEHLTSGGFGSWTLELASSINSSSAIKLFSLDPVALQLVGGQDFLHRMGGLTVQQLVDQMAAG